MAKYLVTGGAGFLGANIVESLVANGDKVVVLDDFSTGNKRNVQDYKQTEVRVAEGDVCDEKLVRKAARGCDYLLHLAGRVGVESSVKNPEECLRVAFEGTLNALTAARDLKVKRFIYASSCAVYGESPVLPKEESMLASPYNPYGAAALLGEELARVFYATYRLETVCLRLFNVYGPRQATDGPSAGVIGRFSAAILKGEKAEVYGDGKQSRDFVYVSDVVDAFRLACTAPKAEGEVFNIASGARMSVAGLLNGFTQLLERDIEHEAKEARPSDVRHSLADILKAQEVLGYRPRVTIAEGLAKTLLWYKKNLGKAIKGGPRL
ncbi:MAG: NAD-dependent epimerase/dehydratase family protein [Planctomycetota bacterium]|nr:NAD-dependent epimerase/dehydratase family protein [Planctomycetota bacterium]